MSDVDDQARTRVLDAADTLFYSHGIRAVGMDRIRDLSGVPLRRLYRCFPSKDELVVAYLRRRDRVARAALAERVGRHTDPRERVLEVYEWLHDWFHEAGFRGCAFTNAFSEVGGDNAEAARTVRAHQQAVRAYLRELVGVLNAADPDSLTDQLMVLVSGAINTALITGSPEPARHARAAAASLLPS
ncbi:TetR family transcriptional regulator [Actinophytocola xinjiangensis]|uniref:TetR family transcriptional regulator n=1 Tax=Actinophytocola xinjiangensis TaxID=485602 RepID=A0A7Z0WMZ6_9PSEU|nr:TetR/AcrR family transcriptional regulator [Actinophytocola xinjiangensis]OLF10658.1 TetR family transcriptional regulator [Actinophytocola xinjiangensis]